MERVIALQHPFGSTPRKHYLQRFSESQIARRKIDQYRKASPPFRFSVLFCYTCHMARQRFPEPHQLANTVEDSAPLQENNG